MQSEEDSKISYTRYLLWVVFTIISEKFEQLCIGPKGLRFFAVFIFILISIFVLYTMFHRFQHEERMFADSEQNLVASVTSHFGIVMFAVLAIGAFMLLISYFKAKGGFPTLVTRVDYANRGALAFWFDLIATAGVISVEQQFVSTGYFFNYFWSRSNGWNTLMGILISGLIFGLLNLDSFHLVNYFIYCAIGWVIATVYLATQNFKISLMLGVFVGILKVILI